MHGSERRSTNRGSLWVILESSKRFRPQQSAWPPARFRRRSSNRSLSNSRRTSQKNEITKGGYVPLVFGRRIVGCSVGWVGDRVSHAAEHSGGSEIMSQPSSGNVYYEGAWHQIACGPIRKLHRIFAGDQTIFSREIDFSVVPDGTLYQLSRGFQARDADYFRVFSGRDRLDGVDYQPVDSYLKKHTGLCQQLAGARVPRLAEKKLRRLADVAGHEIRNHHRARRHRARHRALAAGFVVTASVAGSNTHHT